MKAKEKTNRPMSNPIIMNIRQKYLISIHKMTDEEVEIAERIPEVEIAEIEN